MLRNPISRGFLFSKILSCPFWGIFLLVPTLLYKECHVTPLQLSIVIALKPLCGIFSAYWSHHALSKRVIHHLVLAQTIKFVPFLFFPFVSSSWLIIIAFAIHMTLARGVMPAWMELLKTQKDHSARLCAWGGNIDYIGTTFLPLLYGWILDRQPLAWQLLFCITALISLLSLFFLLKIPELSLPPSPPRSMQFLTPWKSLVTILRKRPDFRHFQMGFFLGGAGLMIMQPALPVYFIDYLELSYTEILIAIATCKGLGFLFSSLIWAKAVQQKPIFSLCALITLLAATFPLFLFSAHWNTLWVYIAYLMYGVMQGGSELCWKLSGPLFSKQEPSAPYSAINLLMVGIRGVIFPFLGGIASNTGGAGLTLALGGLLCTSATFYLWHHRRDRERIVLRLL